MKIFVHAAAGAVALLMVCLFFTATVLSEVSGDPATITLAKAWILNGMVVLIPAMILVGASGFSLGARWKGPVVARKKRRMRVIAANGLLVLLPSAWYLARLAAEGRYDGVFVAVQCLELVAGAVNITLLALNMRDGMRLRPKGGTRAAAKAALSR